MIEPSLLRPQASAVNSGTASGPLLAATEPSDRFAPVDILRGIALFGVLIVNLVKEFRVSTFAQFLPSAPESSANRFLDSVVSYVFEMKAFALFSLLFGFGLGIQFDRLVTRELVQPVGPAGRGFALRY